MNSQSQSISKATNQEKGAGTSVSLQRKCGCGQHTSGGNSCSSCGQSQSAVQQSAHSVSASAGDLSGIRDQTNSNRNAGAPLPGGLRNSLESYLNTRLDHVRVHADPQSQTAAHQLNASAFTLGHDIHLGADGVGASGAAKTALLAHEVVHTLQQGPVTMRAKAKVGTPGDAYEQQADRLAAGFSRFQRNPKDAIALHLRDSMQLQSVSSGAPVIQRGRVPTHFGEFEDFQYQNLTDAAGTEIGVEMYLKFHPGNNVRADLIGMTQAAQGKLNGVQITGGLRGQRSATAGAGIGSFIDQEQPNRNPMYAAEGNNIVAGGNAQNLADYQTTGITPLTPAQQTARTAATGVTGVRSQGWGQHGFRKVVAGSFVTQPAELFDAPVLSPSGPNSEQTFETTALAIAGPQNGTYYGSVEWGWRKDAAGAFSRVPLSVVSQGIPSVTFLTAANIWNQSKASFGFIATSATNLLNNTGGNIGPIPIDAELEPTGRAGTLGGTPVVEVNYGGNTGLVAVANIRPGTIGDATVDLPVPMIHHVSNPAGTTMILKTPLASLVPGQPATTTLALPNATRVRTTRCMAPTVALPNHYEGTIADGPHTGTVGFFVQTDLTLETLGTH